MTDEHLEIHAVDEARWPDLVRLMEGRGGPRHCWCLAWREPHAVRSELDLDGRRAAMEQRVRAGTPIGLLAYLDERPVGWCSIAPRESYLERGLGGDEYPEDTEVWAIFCFFVHSSARRRGIQTGLLRAAVDHARSNGADVVEAYPVDADSSSYRHMGFRPNFLAAGFEEVGRVGSRRYVVRLPVASA